MKKYITYVSVAALSLTFLTGCVKSSTVKPYDRSLKNLTIELNYPLESESFARTGVEVKLEEINNTYKYSFFTDKADPVKGISSATFNLPRGLYRASVSDVGDGELFNGSREDIILDEPCKYTLKLKSSSSGSLVIKEIYNGGCKKTPHEGNYQSDKYVMLHNNADSTIFLDSLCFGTLAPYNSVSMNPWGEIQDFAPVIQAVWQFPGRGKDHPLAPGEDAVICLYGAIDHTVTYPLSVNLNKKEYYVCYNSTYFTNENYHPAPGDQIQRDHILQVVIKTGQANAYTFSVTSPAAIIFRIKGMSAQQYVQREGSVVTIPGSSSDRVVKIPWGWVVDGVDVFDGGSSLNYRRLDDIVDSGHAILSDSYLGHTLMRKKNEAKSEKAGYEVLVDTNNSTNDFYERETASIRE